MSPIRETTEADRLIESARLIIVTGPGGVGKTTLSAALAARAAQLHHRRTLVVTVDPARRLADALGLDEFDDEAVLVPVGAGDGRFWARMVDMERSWDALVVDLAPDGATADQLLSNRLYRTLTQRFVQSHDYIALDQLVGLTDDDRYDLVVIDTPPSVHALDVLDAPERMLDFFASRLLRWLTAPYRNRLVMTAAKPFLAVAERLLGGPFLAEIADFFWLFSALQPEFVVRATDVRDRLDDPATRYVVVHTAEAGPAQQARELRAELAKRGHHVALRLVNRVLAQEMRDLDDEQLATVVHDDARAALTAVQGQARRQADLVADPIVGDTAGDKVQTVSWHAEAVGDLEGLVALLDQHHAG